MIDGDSAAWHRQLTDILTYVVVIDWLTVSGVAQRLTTTYADTQTHRQTDRHTVTQTERQTHRQTDVYIRLRMHRTNIQIVTNI